jgi:hypothetical protein
MKEMKSFLSKLLTTQSITKEIREEALLLRDSIDLAEKTDVTQDDESRFPYDFPYEGIFNGRGHTIFSLVDIKKIHNKALSESHPVNPGKIAFIKALRAHYKCGLKDAKEFAEWLYDQYIVHYE